MLYTRNDDASKAQAAAKRYLGAWSGGSDSAAAKLTDQPSAAAAALTASRRGLDGARVHAVLKGDVDEQDGRATAPVAVAWRVPGIGSFAYRTTLRLTQRGERWVVRWSPRAIHPRLTAQTRLGTSTDTPARGRILARDGRAIVKPRAVVDVAVEVAKVRDPAETARGLAAIDGIDADAAALAKRIRVGAEAQLRPGHHPAPGRLRPRGGEPRRDPRRVAERAQVAAAADQDLRPRAARHRRAGDGRAAREDPVARPRRRDRPVGPPGRVPGAARRRGDAQGRDPRYARPATRARRCSSGRAGARGPCAPRSTCACRRRPRRRSRRSRATRRSSPSSPRRATSSRSPTAPRTRPTIAR